MLQNFSPAEASGITAFMSYRAEIKKAASERHEQEKGKKMRTNIHSLMPGSLVMLKEKERVKLQKHWTGPFVVEGKTSEWGHSYSITHPRGGMFPFKIHLDHIKAFTPRTSYLNPDNADEELWTEKDTAIRRPNLMRRRAVLDREAPKGERTEEEKGDKL